MARRSIKRPPVFPMPVPPEALVEIVREGIRSGSDYAISQAVGVPSSEVAAIVERHAGAIERYAEQASRAVRPIEGVWPPSYRPTLTPYRYGWRQYKAEPVLYLWLVEDDMGIMMFPSCSGARDPQAWDDNTSPSPIDLKEMKSMGARSVELAFKKTHYTVEAVDAIRSLLMSHEHFSLTHEEYPCLGEFTLDLITELEAIGYPRNTDEVVHTPYIGAPPEEKTATVYGPIYPYALLNLMSVLWMQGVKCSEPEPYRQDQVEPDPMDRDYAEAIRWNISYSDIQPYLTAFSLKPDGFDLRVKMGEIRYNVDPTEPYWSASMPIEFRLSFSPTGDDVAGFKELYQKNPKKVTSSKEKLHNAAALIENRLNSDIVDALGLYGLVWLPRKIWILMGSTWELKLTEVGYIFVVEATVKSSWKYWEV